MYEKGSDAFKESMVKQFDKIDINSVNITDQFNYRHSVVMKDYLADQCVDRIAQDLYELKKLEIIEEVRKEDLMDRLNKKMKDEISQKIDNIVKGS